MFYEGQEWNLEDKMHNGRPQEFASDSLQDLWIIIQFNVGLIFIYFSRLLELGSSHSMLELTEKKNFVSIIQ